jgi:aminopeptidase N
VPQPLRLSAIRALGVVSKGQEPPQVELVLSMLGDLAKETFFLTQLAVVASLGQMETAKAIGTLQSIATQTPDGRVRRIAEEAIAQVQGHIGSDKAVKQLREELDEMKKENQQLKSRLENLEAKSAKSSD